jgi:hypothetical protein
MTIDYERVRKLFNEARKLTLIEQEPFLDQECGSDDALGVENTRGGV